MKKYIDTAIGENIQFAIEHAERSDAMFRLRELYHAGVLIRAIRCVVENLVKCNVRHALSNILDIETIERSMKQSEELGVDITDIHRSRIEEYLKGMDVITVVERYSFIGNIQDAWKTI